MKAPHLICGFDHRELVTRWLTASEWHTLIDELSTHSEITITEGGPHGTCLHDERGPLLDIEAGLDEIRRVDINDNGDIAT